MATAGPPPPRPYVPQTEAEGSKPPAPYVPNLQQGTSYEFAEDNVEIMAPRSRGASHPSQPPQRSKGLFFELTTWLGLAQVPICRKGFETLTCGEFQCEDSPPDDPVSLHDPRPAPFDEAVLRYQDGGEKYHAEQRPPSSPSFLRVPLDAIASSERQNSDLSLGAHSNSCFACGARGCSLCKGLTQTAHCLSCGGHGCSLCRSEHADSSGNPCISCGGHGCSLCRSQIMDAHWGKADNHPELFVSSDSGRKYTSECSPILVRKTLSNRFIAGQCDLDGLPITKMLSGKSFTVVPKGSVETTTHQYEGQHKNGKPDGFGRMTFNTGDVYEGHWEKGKENGEGTFFRSCSTEGLTLQYKGQWRGGLRHGYGTEFWSDGMRYEGEFRDGDADGSGAVISKTGIVRRTLDASMVAAKSIS